MRAWTIGLGLGLLLVGCGSTPTASTSSPAPTETVQSQAASPASTKFVPLGEECSVPSDVKLNQWVQKTGMISTGSTPEAAIQTLGEPSMKPAPKGNVQSLIWQKTLSQYTLEIGLTFEDEKLTERAISTIQNPGQSTEKMCAWTLQ